jgi:intracellular septation protein
MSDQQAKPVGAASAPSPLLKLLIEIGPLVAFFAAYARAGIYWATGILMIATVIALLASWRLLGRISAVPVITAVLVVVFGGLTFLLDDPRFIKMKPTMINLIFAVALVGGVWLGKSPLKLMLGEAFSLTPEGWRILSYRWAGFFLALAVINEIVWRNFSEQTWVSFKAFGILPLTFLFAMAQIGVMRRFEDKPAEQLDAAGPQDR